MGTPRLMNDLGDIISGGRELYNKIYHALGGNSGGGYDYYTQDCGYYNEDNSGDYGNIIQITTTTNNPVIDDGPRTEPDIYSESIAITCNEDPKIYCRKGVIKVVSRSNVNTSTAKEIVDKYINDRVQYGFKIKRFEFDEDREEIYVTLTRPGVKLIHTFDVI